MQQNDLLKYAIENGIIDFDTIQAEYEMNERKKYFEMHPYKKWEDKQGIWHTYLPDDKKGRIRKKKKTESEIDKIIIDYWRGKSENPTVAEVFEEWNDRRLELNKISPASHLRNKQYFERHYKEFGKYKIKNLESEDFIDFLEEQIPEYNLTAKAFANIKGITKGFLKRAKKRKLIDWNIEEALYELDVSDVDFKKVVKEDYQVVFDDEEMLKMIQYLEEHLDKRNMAILLMFATGLRIGEVVALKPETLEKDYIKVRRTETRYLGSDNKYIYAVKEHPKTAAGVRDVVIPPGYANLYKEIRLLNPFGEYVFVNEKGERLTTVAIRRRLERVCKNAQVYHKSPHKIRNTYGSILLDNNTDERFVINQMGHTNISCTENHYHRNRRSIEKKKEILSNIPELNCI